MLRDFANVRQSNFHIEKLFVVIYVAFTASFELSKNRVNADFFCYDFVYFSDCLHFFCVPDGRTICGRRARVEMSNGKGGGGRYRGPPPRSRGRPFHPDDRCYECGDRGHYARDCGRYRRGRRRYLLELRY